MPPFHVEKRSGLSKLSSALMGFTLVMCLNLNAETATEPSPYSPKNLERQALEHHPQLKVAFHQWQSMLSQVAVARSLPDPTLSYTEFLEEVQTRVGPQRRKIGLMQMLPWFGTLKRRGDAALAKAEILAQHLQDKSLEVIEQVRLSLYDLVLLERQVDISEKHLGILKNLEKSSQGGFAAGRGHLSNVLRIQVDIDALQDQISTLRAMRTPMRQKLERSVGSPLARPIPTSWPTMEDLPSLAVLEVQYRRQHPQWIANQKALDVASAQVALAQKQGRPHFEVGLSWVDTGPALMPNTMGSGDDPIAFTLSMSLPIWRGKVNGGVQSALQSQKSTEHQFESLIQDFRLRMSQLIFRWEDSQRKIKLYRDQLLPKARDAYESAKKGHESNVVSFQNVMDAERSLLRFSLDLETALHDQATAQAQLERLSSAPPKIHP